MLEGIHTNLSSPRDLEDDEGIRIRELLPLLRLQKKEDCTKALASDGRAPGSMVSAALTT